MKWVIGILVLGMLWMGYCFATAPEDPNDDNGDDFTGGMV